MTIFQESVNINLAKIKFLTLFISSLLQRKTGNLNEIAKGFADSAKVESNYKRIKRFFSSYKINMKYISQILIKMVPAQKPWVLTLDRTNWKLGKKDINILLIGVAYKNIAFPIMWSMLEKRGNSNYQERKSIIERLLQILPTSSIKCVTADREFVGKEWLEYLSERGINYRIRIKNNMHVSDGRRTVAAKCLFRHVAIGRSYYYTGSKRLKDSDVKVYLAGVKEEKDYVIIATNTEVRTALEDYRKRWQTETLFACLKGKGFNFKKTHLSIPERVEKLVALLAIAFVWAHYVGEWKHENVKAIEVKKNGYKTYSFFRYGLDMLDVIFSNMTYHRVDYRRTLRILRSLFRIPYTPCLT